jgi:hypothetical protein
MTIARRLDNGHILAPVTFRYTDPDGTEYLGEGQRELAPGDPEYDAWDEYLTPAK